MKSGELDPARRGSIDWGGSGIPYLVLSALWLVINLVTAERSPPVWFDEVMYSDPAVNLHFGSGLTSSAWAQASDARIYSAAPPLYQLLLSRWLDLWGFGLVEVRSLNYVLALLAAIIIVRASVIGRVLSHPWSRFGLFAALLVAPGITFCYRCGRIDTLNTLLCALLFYGWMARARWAGLSICALSCFAIGWAGTQVMAYAALFGTIGVICYRGAVFERWLASGVGGALGAGSLMFFYWAHGALGDFRNTTRNYLHTFFLGSNGFHDIGYWVFLGVNVAALAIVAWRGASAVRQPAAFALLVGIGLPLAIMFVGHYPIYYSWMGFLPLAVGGFLQLDRLADQGRGTIALALAALGVFLVTGAGLGGRMFVTARDWAERSYDPVRRLVAAHVDDGACAMGEVASYYALRPRAGLTYTPLALKIMPPDQRTRVRFLVAGPDTAPVLAKELGGTWQEFGRVTERTVPHYRLVVMKRLQEGR